MLPSWAGMFPERRVRIQALKVLALSSQTVGSLLRAPLARRKGEKISWLKSLHWKNTLIYFELNVFIWRKNLTKPSTTFYLYYMSTNLRNSNRTSIRWQKVAAYSSQIHIGNEQQQVYLFIHSCVISLIVVQAASRTGELQHEKLIGVKIEVNFSSTGRPIRGLLRQKIVFQNFGANSHHIRFPAKHVQNHLHSRRLLVRSKAL